MKILAPSLSDCNKNGFCYYQNDPCSFGRVCESDPSYCVRSKKFHKLIQLANSQTTFKARMIAVGLVRLFAVRSFGSTVLVTCSQSLTEVASHG